MTDITAIIAAAPFNELHDALKDRQGVRVANLAGGRKRLRCSSTPYKPPINSLFRASWASDWASAQGA